MSKRLKSSATRTQLAWLLPILALSPFALAAKGCNAGVIGDDCPSGECTAGSAGKGTAGTGAGGGHSNVCGGLLGTACADDQFCDFPRGAQCGAADQTGTCVAKPEACDLVYAPVCGCDDKTYGNECSAHGAGVSVAHAGECEPSGGGGSGSGGGTGTAGSGSGGSEFCGGIAAIPCPDGQYCDLPLSSHCGAADQGGSCKPIPKGCNKILQPVCGCDGKTYDNACVAASAGVSVAAEGECKSSGGACGEIGGCAPGEYCNFAPDADCGHADQPGVCAKIPVNGACIAIYDPVCGCDGKTYSSDCVARLAGMSIAAKGECEPPAGESCGGLTGKQCAKGSFCDFPADMPACGAADATGICTPSPEACDQVLAEVCGCDGQTYGNECTANAAGTDVAHTGPCE